MKHGKRDGNHADVRDALRSIPGCRVHDTGDVGGGFPDLVVGFTGKIMLFEIKDGSLSPSRRKLTPDEKRFHADWSHLPVYVVESVDEAYAVLGLEAPPF